MEIFRIKSKYCTDDKVQLMLSNAPHQIICSNDGYIFMQEEDVTVHKYLQDPSRKNMPYKNNPSSVNHVNHLFEYNKLYAKITSNRNMRYSVYPNDGGFDFTFLYFTKLKNGDALGAEIPLSYFKSQLHEKTQYFTSKELADFLYRIKGDIKGKCIFYDTFGIEYAKFKNEEIFIDKNFLDISDNAIIAKYNKQKEFTSVPLFNIEQREKLLKERPWEIDSIDKIEEELVLTYQGLLDARWPKLLVVKGTQEMEVYYFKVSFCKKDCFKVVAKKTPISFGIRDIMTCAANIDYVSYTSEPDFD